MYMDDDTLTPRDRIGEEMLHRMLDGAPSPSDFPSQGTRKPPHQKTTWGLTDYPIAMVYAPLQAFRNLYDRETALQKGTIFQELDLPFMGKSVKKGGSFRG